MLKAVSTPSAATLALHPGYISGRHYSTWYQGVSTTNAIPGVDTIYFYLGQIFAPITFTSASARVITGGAGSSIKVGIWAMSPVSARPLGAPLVVDNAGVATTTTNTNITVALSGSLAPGFYWFGSKATGTLPVCVGAGVSIQVMNAYAGFIPSGSSSTQQLSGLSLADAYAGDMPTIAEGASFSSTTGAGTPIFSLVAA